MPMPIFIKTVFDVEKCLEPGSAKSKQFLPLVIL